MLGRHARLSLLVAAIGLGGCDPRDCILGIAHGDCPQDQVAATFFPQDDAICRDYGLAPGTKDYALCRIRKRHERALTGEAANNAFLQNPLTPDVRVVTPAPLPHE